MIRIRPHQWYRIVLLGFGCALFVYVFVKLGAARILALLLEIGWSFAWIALTYAGYELLRAFAYWKCITATRHSSYWDMVRFTLSGDAVQFLTSTGPFLAAPAKMWLLQRQGLSPRHAVAATVSEYLIYTLTSAAFGIVGLTYLLRTFDVSRGFSIAGRIILWVMSVFLLTAAVAIVNRIYLIGALIKWTRKLPFLGRRLPFEDKDVRETENLLLMVLRDRPALLLSILLVEFAAQALLVLELLILLRQRTSSVRSWIPS